MPRLIDLIDPNAARETIEAGGQDPNVPAPVQSPITADPQDISLEDYSKQVVSRAGQTGVSISDAEQSIKKEEALKQGFLSRTVKAWQRADESVNIDFIWSDVHAGKRSRQEAEQLTKEFRQRIADNPIEARNWAEKLWLKTVAVANPMLAGQYKGVAYGTMAAGAVAAAGQAGPQALAPEEVLTVPGGFTAGHLWGTLSYWSEQGKGSIYREATEAGVPNKTAKLVASIGGPLYGAVEFSQVDRLIPGIGRVRRPLISILLKYLKTVGTEVAEEGVQKAITESSTLWGKIVEGMISTSEVPAEIKKVAIASYREAKEALDVMAVLAGGSAVVEVVTAKKGKPKEERRGILIEIMNRRNKLIAEIEGREGITPEEKETMVESQLAQGAIEIEQAGAEPVVQEGEEGVPEFEEVVEDDLEVPEDLAEREPHKLAEDETAITKKERLALQDKGLSLGEIAKLSPDEARALLEAPEAAEPGLAVAKEGKFDWELTIAEKIESEGFGFGKGKTEAQIRKNLGDEPVDTLLRGYKKGVQKALSEGKPVPAEVLAEYPDLASVKPSLAKEPWEMTTKEYVKLKSHDYLGQKGITEDRGLAYEHKKIVEEATKAGKLALAKPSPARGEEIAELYDSLQPLIDKTYDIDEKAVNSIIESKASMKAWMDGEYTGELNVVKKEMQQAIAELQALASTKPTTAAPSTQQTETASEERSAEQTTNLTPPTDAEIAETNKELRRQLRQARKLRRDEVEPAIADLHSRQAARAAAMGRRAAKSGLPAAEVIRKSKAGYKDKADIPVVTPPALTEAQWDVYARKVYSVYPGPQTQFKQTDAQDALDRLRAGKILTKYEIELLRPIVGEKMAADLDKAHGAFRNPQQKKWDTLRDIILMWKTPFAFDVQFFRQAITFAPRHPIRYTKGAGKAIGAYLSHKYADRLIEQVENNPNHADAANYVNFIRADIFAPTTERAEQFRGRGPERLTQVGAKRGFIARTLTAPIRGFGKWYMASERSMTASVNWFLQDLWDRRQAKWDASLKLLEAEGLSDAERGCILNNVDKGKRRYGDTLNTFIKILRAKSTTGKQIQGVANLILWSPSMTWARVRRPKTLLNNPVYAATLVATDVAKIYAVQSAIAFIANQFRDEDDKVKVEMDPRASNWGKVKVGDTWYDLGGGEVQYYRTLAQLAMGEVKNQAGRTSKVSRIGVLMGYAESRQTALLGIFREIFTGKSMFGEKVWEMPDWDELEKENTVASDLIAGAGREIEKVPGGKEGILIGRSMHEHMMPSFIQAFIDTSMLDGWPQNALAATSEALSMAVTSYKTRAKVELQMFQDEVADQMFGDKWENLNEKQQKQIMEMEEAQEIEVKVRADAGKFESFGDKFLSPEERQAKLRISSRMGEFVREGLDEVKMSAGGISRKWGEFRLNDERFKAYEELASQHIEDALIKLFGRSGYQRKSIGKKADEVRKTIEAAKSKARDELRREIDRDNI